MTTLQAGALTTPEEFFAPATIPDRFKKAVGVVQIAMGSLGLLHRKVYNVLYANASVGLEEGKTKFSIKVGDLAEVAGFESNDYRLIHECGAELVTTKVSLIDFDEKPNKNRKGRRGVGTATLLSEFKLWDDGTIT